MGLDQYFHREVHTYEMVRDGDTCKTVDGIDIPAANLGGSVSRTTDDRVGYLRKANAVHGWIVDNLAGGEDECQRIHLSVEDVSALLREVEFALATGEGMEPRSGFFFGSTDKDEYWREDLKTTRDILTWILDDAKVSKPDPENSYWYTVDYYYQASW